MALFEALAEQGPTVVVFEDIHWAEEPLLDLIETLADEVRDLPLVLVCLSRPELLEARRTWGGGMTNAATISLEPLSASESEELVALLDAGGELDAESRARVVLAAEGNPLFMEQTVAYLRERTDATRGAGLPATIHALLAARLDRLPMEERALLSRAAVVGREFTRSALLALTPEGEREGVDDRLRALARRELVTAVRGRGENERQLRFSHVLICDTAYGALPKHERSDLHHRYATWLESSSSGAAELDEILGYHLEKAYEYRAEIAGIDDVALGLAAAAIERLSTAAHRAIARDDLQAGVGLLRRAAAVPAPDRRTRLGILAEMGPALVQLGEVQAVDAVLREIVHTVDPAPADPLDALARTIETSSEEDEVDTVIATAEKAADIFRSLGDDRHLAQVLLVIGDLHMLQLPDDAVAGPPTKRRCRLHGRARTCRRRRRSRIRCWRCTSAARPRCTSWRRCMTTSSSGRGHSTWSRSAHDSCTAARSLSCGVVTRPPLATTFRNPTPRSASTTACRAHALITQLTGDLALAEAQAREGMDDRRARR